MARNYLIFLFGLIVLFAFSFVFCYQGVYGPSLIAGVLACVGFVAALVISLIIGVASREEGGSLYIYFFVITGITAIVLVWFLTRAGVLLEVW
jgi:hypothetical protein